jgi:hypothetical protein
LKFDNDFIIATAKESEKAEVYSVTKGAYFNSMYNFFIQKIKEKYNIEVNVLTKTVYSKDFERLLKE